MASLLAGTDAPLDPGDGSGMNLMDLSSGDWWEPAVSSDGAGPATIGCRWFARRGPIAGTLSTYWQQRHGFPPARVVAWSGDNPCSLIGTGLVREGRVAVSLGTSDVIFGLMEEPRVDSTGTGHVFGAPTGAFMGLTVFKNGSLARERVRDSFGLSWPEFSRAARVDARRQQRPHLPAVVRAGNHAAGQHRRRPSLSALPKTMPRATCAASSKGR